MPPIDNNNDIRETESERMKKEEITELPEWVKLVLENINPSKKRGEEVFTVRFSPGRPPKLSDPQKRKLEKILLKGAMAHGFRTELWTTPRIGQVIEKAFGVRYHPDHIGRLMSWLGWSHQKPERRAIERDEERIKRWTTKEWPRIKKTLQGWVPI